MRRLLSFLFLLSLTLSWCLAHLLVNWHIATAMSPNGSQLVQQGVNLYQIDNFKGAIASWQTALKFYQKTKNHSKAATVRENLAKAYEQIGNSKQAVEHWEEAIAYHRQIKDLPYVGRLLTEQAQSYSSLGQPRTAIELLCGAYGRQQECVPNSAIYLAQTYQDRQTEAAALGSLGNAYRLMGEDKQAIAYLQASSNILNASQAVNLDFQDRVEPIYRELAQLRLEQASSRSIEPQERSKQLSAALNTIDSLRLAELQNYLGNDCVLTALDRATIELLNADPTTAVFSLIILDKRTAVILSLPNGQKKLAWIDVNRQNLRQIVNEFRRGLERYRDFTYDSIQAQQLYDWIIRPFTDDLEAANIKTLVFIRDGILRSIPMAALHDGTQFLVQKYAIANTPTLTLTVTETLRRQKLKALILGLTKQATVNGRNFPALANVSSEISQIKAQIPNSKQLLNDAFTSDRLQQELSKTVYPIIHIATHGVFGTDPEDTFLVTGNNDKLTLTELDTTIRSMRQESESVDLLTLTACQTAAGDERAALGLAGVAVQAGVKSALASLWFIQDAPTVTLITKFYTSLLNAKASKAEALRKAQIALIESGGQYTHPAYWAAFILIGNWL